jgi:hypothetical protein
MLFPTPCERRNTTLYVLQMHHAHSQAIGTQILISDGVPDANPGPGRRRHLKQRVVVTCMSVLFHALVSVGTFDPSYQSHLTRGKDRAIDLV